MVICPATRAAARLKKVNPLNHLSRNDVASQTRLTDSDIQSPGAIAATDVETLTKIVINSE